MKINNRNIYVVGDIHGYPRPFISDIEKLDLRDSIFFLLGDIGIGFNDDHTGPAKFLNAEGLKRNNFFYLIRGNHDNPKSYTGEIKAKNELKYSNVRYLEDFDEIEFEFNGKKGLVVPGAVSIDRSIRIPDKSWWENETIAYDRILELEGKSYDFVLAHTGPEPLYIKIDDTVERIARRQDPLLLDDLKKEHNSIDKIIEIVKPDYWFNGHFHRYDNFYHNGVNVYTIAEYSGDAPTPMAMLPKELLN